MPVRSPTGAVLTVPTARLAVPAPSAVVLVLHGGPEVSTAPVRPWDPASLRMVALADVLQRRLPTTTVVLLRYGIRGWNGTGDAAVADARWALRQLRRRWPDSPVVLLGHSMGTRVAVRVVAGTAGAVLLAP